MVTTPRGLADYVVTEYGIANLMGKNFRERADALIGIAHPDFRAELKKEAQRLFYPCTTETVSIPNSLVNRGRATVG